MRQIIDELEKVDWTDANWRKAVIDILRSSHSLRSRLASYMAGWKPQDRLAKLNGSHETSTHYKWLVHRDNRSGFTLWLHDYKVAAQRRPGYAEVPHNHRYDLCSIILRGGYDSVLYDVTRSVSPVDRETLREGEVLSLTHDEVHALEGIIDGTQTFFVEGPVKKHYSRVYPVDGAPCEFMDFEGRWDDFIRRLA